MPVGERSDEGIGQQLDEGFGREHDADFDVLLDQFGVLGLVRSRRFRVICHANKIIEGQSKRDLAFFVAQRFVMQPTPENPFSIQSTGNKPYDVTSDQHRKIERNQLKANNP